MGQMERMQTSMRSGRLTLATDSTSPSISFAEFAGGMIFIPSDSSIALLTFYAAPWNPNDGEVAADAQTFYALYDLAGSAVTLVVAAGKAYPLPPECFGAGALKILVDVAGTVELSKKA